MRRFPFHNQPLFLMGTIAANLVAHFGGLGFTGCWKTQNIVILNEVKSLSSFFFYT